MDAIRVPDYETLGHILQCKPHNLDYALMNDRFLRYLSCLIYAVAIPLLLFPTCQSSVFHDLPLDVAFSTLIEDAEQEMWFRLNRQRDLRPQLDELCQAAASATTKRSTGIESGCQERMKLLVICFDRTVYKRFKVNFAGRKVDLVLSNVMDANEWSNESLLVCRMLSHGLDQDVCVQSVGSWLQGISSHISSLKPLRTDTQPEFIPATSVAAWYGMTIDTERGFAFIDRHSLLSSMKTHPADFETALPWPHTVVDNLIEPSFLQAVVHEVENALSKSLHIKGTWRAMRDKSQVKFGVSDPAEVGQHTKNLIAELKSTEFLRYLERMTSIPGLIPDPWDIGGGN